jgi:uncharacterized membrane protein YdbT with pleckstrin-like domain
MKWINWKAVLKTLLTLIVVMFVATVFVALGPMFWIRTLLVTLIIWGVAKLYIAYDEDDNNN